MSRAMHLRLLKLERAIEDAQPAEPGFVWIPRHMAGTPAALADEQAFRLAHPGAPLAIVQMVDGRKPPETIQ